jgi:molybdate transport repressor ModE-like protein
MTTRRWANDLGPLRLLVAVGEHGSITEAARLEGVSQPGASKQIAALERSMSLPLLRRAPSGSTLTAEGEVVASWAGRVLDTVEQMRGAVESMRSHASSDLVVAASMTVAEHLAPTWLSTLRATRPDIHVGLRVTNSQDVQALVLHEQVDLGFVETAALDPHVESRRLMRDRLAVVVAPTHAWATRRRPLLPDDLARTPLIVREHGSGTRETLDRLLRGIQSAEPLLVLGSNEAVKGAVKAGVGAAVLSVLAVGEDVRRGNLVEVDVENLDLHRPISAVWRHDQRLDDAARALLRTAASGSLG